jgi:hypothetical protein
VHSGRTEGLVCDVEPKEVEIPKLNRTFGGPDGILDLGDLSRGFRARNVTANPQVCAVMIEDETRSIRV